MFGNTVCLLDIFHCNELIDRVDHLLVWLFDFEDTISSTVERSCVDVIDCIVFDIGVFVIDVGNSDHDVVEE